MATKDYIRELEQQCFDYWQQMKKIEGRSDPDPAELAKLERIGFLDQATRLFLIEKLDQLAVFEELDRLEKQDRIRKLERLHEIQIALDGEPPF